MPHYSKEQIESARRMDVLTYLEAFEPTNLVKVSNGTYCTKEHDSLKISNGMWHWFSRDIGGKSALDYLIAVKGYTFQQGLEALLGQAAALPPVFVSPKKSKKPPIFELPERAETNDSVARYLRSRGLCNEVIRFCIRTDRLYEGITEKDGIYYHNAVFVGTDKSGKTKYAHLRGLNTDFKGEATGSDKRFSFSIPADGESKTLHLFEAAIDLLSFATLEKLKCRNWRVSHLLSLAGVYKSNDKVQIPLALEQCLKDYPSVKEIYLHLDNDEIGRAATESIRAVLSEQYAVYDVPPEHGKDVNDELKQVIRNQKKEEFDR